MTRWLSEFSAIVKEKGNISHEASTRLVIEALEELNQTVARKQDLEMLRVVVSENSTTLLMLTETVREQSKRSQEQFRRSAKRLKLLEDYNEENPPFTWFLRYRTKRTLVFLILVLTIMMAAFIPESREWLWENVIEKLIF